MSDLQKLTWYDYMFLSIRTMPKLIERYPVEKIESLEQLFLGLGETLDRVHMAMGIVSETQELLMAEERYNIGEELGDKCWYISNMIYINNKYEVNTNFVYIFETNFNGDRPDWEWAKTELAELDHIIIDSAKKELAYKANNLITNDILTRYLGLIQFFANHFKIDMNEALARNINKLKVRFPDKFTEENAIYRDIEKEKKVL